MQHECLRRIIYEKHIFLRPDCEYLDKNYTLEIVKISVLWCKNYA